MTVVTIYYMSYKEPEEEFEDIQQKELAFKMVETSIYHHNEIVTY